MNQIFNVSDIKSLSRNAGSSETIGVDFRNLFQGLVENVEKTEAMVNMDAYNLSVGNVDDLHTIMIHAAQAELALETMVQLRNKFLDAYQEVMRINL